MNTKLNTAEADALTAMPLVTVYMPTHNRVELLKRAIESVLNQDYRNIELIVVDDRSTDSTPEYLETVIKTDSRVRYFINEKNSGACVSRNKAISAAKGEFVTGLDDDDYFLPNHISSFLYGWDNKKLNTVALYADVFKKTTSGIKPTYNKINKCIAKQLIHSNLIGNQIFARTESLLSCGGFDPNFPALQDLECWYNLLKKTGGIAEATNIYSYVVDISHPHERISNKKTEVIKVAFELFCNKHNLNDKEKSIFKLLLTNYEPRIPAFSSVLNSLIYWPSIYNIKKLVNLYYKILKFKLNVKSN